MFFLALASALTVHAADSRSDPYAIAGVGVAIVTGDDLDSADYGGYPVGHFDAVVVIDPSELADYHWTTLVTDRAGDPLVGYMPASALSTPILSALDSSFRSGYLLAVSDADLLQDRIDSAIVGPCGVEPDMDGVVDPSLLTRYVARSLYYSGLDFDELAVGVTAYGAETNPVTNFSSRYTGLDPITIINPDSMHPGGWCGAAPTPHP